MQVCALNAGAIMTGIMYGSNLYLTNRLLFAGHVFFNAINFIALLRG